MTHIGSPEYIDALKCRKEEAKRSARDALKKSKDMTFSADERARHFGWVKTFARHAALHTINIVEARQIGKQNEELKK